MLLVNLDVGSVLRHPYNCRISNKFTHCWWPSPRCAASKLLFGCRAQRACYWGCHHRVMHDPCQSWLESLTVAVLPVLPVLLLQFGSTTAVHYPDVGDGWYSNPVMPNAHWSDVSSLRV